MTEQLPIIVAGAGPGGLSAALALAHNGFPVLLLERNQLPNEVGAGIQISPNATASLKEWGVLPYLSELAITPEKIRIRSGVSGQQLSEVSTKDISQRFDAPYMVAHRADLQKALYHRASQCDLIELLDERQVREVTESGDSVEVRCRKPDGENIFYRGAALIAADGVWSRIRTDYLGNHPAAYSGKTAWRTTLPIEQVPDSIDSANVGLWLSPKAHLVHYPVAKGSMINIVAIVDDTWNEEGWNSKGDAAWLNKRYEKWPQDIRQMLASADEWLKWALCGQDPNQPWVKGKVALLGDAAHAMLPFMAQGAVMSIEDAAILARAIKEIDAPMEVRLQAYEQARKSRVARVMSKARHNGFIYHMNGPLAAARNAAMSIIPSSQLVKQFDWIYGWRPEEVRFKEAQKPIAKAARS